MIPLMLDPALVKLAVCGNDVLTLRRLAWLRDCGADPLVFSPAPCPKLVELAGDKMVRRLPVSSDLSVLRALWIADIDITIAAPIADMGRALKVLVNVEDVLDFCDFHTPAIVHRGRLTIAIGTSGASPAIASIIRKRLEAAFPPAWADIVDEVAASRLSLKAKGATFSELVNDAHAKLTDAGL